MSVDEKLRLHLSQDLRKAFSLNDRIRFRRSLFSDNDALMDQAIQRVEMMQSQQEVRQHFLGNLSWDENDPDVADFLHIVCSRFVGR